MIRELEENMWKAAQARDGAAFLELVDVNAVMMGGRWKLVFNMDRNVPER